MTEAISKPIRSKCAWPSALGLVLALGQAVANDAPKSTIHFTNGDWLRGSLAAYDQASGVLWEHPDAGGTMQFNISRVTELTLDGAAPSALPPGNLCDCLLYTSDAADE